MTRKTTTLSIAAPFTVLALLAGSQTAHAQTALPAVQLSPAPPPPPPAYILLPRPPPTGLGLLVAGAALTGVGVLNAATAPVCLTFGAGGSSFETTCIAASLVVAGIFVAIGVPLLIVGVAQHNHYVQWRREHPSPFLGALESVGVASVHGGGALTLRVAF